MPVHKHPMVATIELIEDRLDELEDYKQDLNKIPTTTYKQLQHRLRLLDKMLRLRELHRDLQKLYEGRL